MARGRKRRRAVKRFNHAWVDRATDAVLVEGLAKEEAASRGLDLRVSMVRAGRTEFPHWQFRAAGGRDVLFHYWPAKGSWWEPDTGIRGEYSRWEDAITHAEVLLPRKETLP